ncbi:GTP diphosphokinase [Allohahella marinimesophila]|uniref:GTP pyrophosphokinase n=1 Tax=Allohahella marinimesophila TaxID=1054972 RepID=A0ABP7Q4P9_9GAMM
MVKVREDYPVGSNGRVDIPSWLEQLGRFTPVKDSAAILEACEVAQSLAEKAEVEGSRWSAESNSFLTGLEMAVILAELHLDSESIIAAILYRSVREKRITLQAVGKRFGSACEHLIEGVLQMAAISSLRHPLQGSVLGQTQNQVDNLRRMLVTMIDDVRVALIKLAERTCAIRAVKDAEPDKRHRVAREVFDIYAPLAHRLGIGQLKWELEDLSFRYLHESAYKKIAKQLDERRIDRQQYITEVIEALSKELKEQGVQADVDGRVKHIYSIWRKMHRKGIDFSQVYDIRAIRVLVPTIRDCYSVLGAVHSLWRHIPHEFDDYIANPKSNGYQSLHTAVAGPGNKVMEVQIRTHAMHQDAELGVCAHWLYKGTDLDQKSQSYEDKIAWLRQVLEWQEDLGDQTGETTHDLVEQWQNNFVSDRIYLFTPEGHVVDLPANSTPIDFAYKVHTEIGHCCRGAKVNGRIVPLNYKLKTGEQVQVLTSSQPKPSRDWLNPDLGYTQTSKARAKIAHWFRMQNREQHVESGAQLLHEMLKRFSVDSVSGDLLAKSLHFQSVEDLHAAIGAGDLKPMQVVQEAQSMLEARSPELDFDGRIPPKPGQQTRKASLLRALEEAGDSPRKRGKPARLEDHTQSIRILGVGNLLTHRASCCKPVPGDDIIGFITLGRGVSIHKQDCLNVLQLEAQEPNKIIEVSWGSAQETYPIDIEVEAYDRPGLLRDISNVLGNDRVNVLAVSTRSDKENSTATMRLTVEIESLGMLNKIFDRLRQVPNVIDTRRLKEA